MGPLRHLEDYEHRGDAAVTGLGNVACILSFTRIPDGTRLGPSLLSVQDKNINIYIAESVTHRLSIQQQYFSSMRAHTLLYEVLRFPWRPCSASPSTGS